MLGKIFERLKQKWDIRTNAEFFRIMTVFSLAGMNVSLCRKPLFHALGIGSETVLWVKTLIYIALIFPIYQLSLLIYGLILGEFKFFWSKQKLLWKGLKRGFTKRHTTSDKSVSPSPKHIPIPETASE